MIAALLISGLAMAGMSIKPPSVQKPSVDDTQEIEERADGIYNVLVVGTDKVGLNTDTIMVMSLDSINDRANVMSIPRRHHVQCKTFCEKNQCSLCHWQLKMEKAILII